jgi:hypothetical protein
MYYFKLSRVSYIINFYLYYNSHLKEKIRYRDELSCMFLQDYEKLRILRSDLDVLRKECFGKRYYSFIS